MTMTSFTRLTLALTLTLAASSSDVARAASKAADQIQTADAFVFASPGGGKNAGMFVTFKNTADTDHAVVKASSSAAKTVELHTHASDDKGVMRMRPIEKIELKAKSTTELRPGGLHIMLINLLKPLKEGDSVSVEVVYEDGSSRKIEAPVRKFGGHHQMKHKHHGASSKE